MRWGSTSVVVAMLMWAVAPGAHAASPAARGVSSSQHTHVHHTRHKDEGQYATAKGQADARTLSGTNAPAPRAAVYGGNSFPGVSGSAVTPSDSTGDASATQQVEFTNGGFEVWPSPGCPPAAPCSSTGSIYGLVGANPGDCVFDPQIIWDQAFGHWIYIADVQTATGSCTSDINPNVIDDQLVIGYTYSSDATDLLKGNFCWTRLDQGPNLDDYPKLGHDDNSVVVTANVYSNYGAGSFLNSEMWIVANPTRGVSPIVGCAPRIFRINMGGSFTLVPAVMTDSSPVDYVVAAQDPGAGTGNDLPVWRTSYDGSVTFVGHFGVAPYSVPPNVPQPSTGSASCATAGNCLDSLDARLTQAVGHYDPDAGYEAIWTQHAVTDHVSTLSVERWYEVIPATYTVRQSGDVSDPSLYEFNGAVTPTEAGNEALIFYNSGDASAVNGLVSFRAQSRNRFAPLGTMSSETVLATSSASKTDATCGAAQNPPNGLPCRWGDYSGARPDPGNVNGAWGFGMLSAGVSWTTQVVEATPGCGSVQISSAPTTGGVQFTASGVTGCSNPQYQFFLKSPSGAWSVGQAWSSNNVWSWNPSGYPSGTYTIDVWTNQAGDSTVNAESFAVTTWSTPFCSGNSVTADQMSPQPAGTRVTLTSTSMCPDPNPAYEFWLLSPNGTWSDVQPYSTKATYTWDTTGATPGSYHFSVWVRDALSGGVSGTPPNTYDQYGTFDFSISVPPPCSTVSVSASPASSATVGTRVTVTGAASGCSSPRYEFWLRPPGGSWSLVQGYSANATFTWNTAGLAPGTYRFSVWARDASSGAAYDGFSAFDYPLTVQPCTGIGATQSSPSPASIGTTVTVTGSATGCPNPVYEFWLLPPGGSWMLVQGYAPTAAFTWPTSGAPAGTYRFSVWARDLSSSAPYDAFNAFQYTLVVAPCTGLNVTVSPATSAVRGTTVSITAAASGCPNPQYELWYLPPGGSWVLVRGYASSGTFLWSTGGAAAGAYRFSVWARDASSAGAAGVAPYTYDAFSAFQYTVS